MKIVYVARNLLFPERCPICDRALSLLDEPREACAYCRTYLDECYVKEPRCIKCSQHLDDPDKLLCEDCGGKEHLFERGFSLYSYKPLSECIYRFKYQGRREYANFFGKEIERHMWEEIRALNPDAILPVPLYEKKLMKRGYNQALLLAREVGKRFSIPVLEDLIIRTRATRPLKELGPTERKSALKGAFKLARNDVHYKTIIVMDDIYTTGATMDAIAGQLALLPSHPKCYFLTLAVGQGI